MCKWVLKVSMLLAALFLLMCSNCAYADEGKIVGENSDIQADYQPNITFSEENGVKKIYVDGELFISFHYDKSKVTPSGTSFFSREWIYVNTASLRAFDLRKADNIAQALIGAIVPGWLGNILTVIGLWNLVNSEYEENYYVQVDSYVSIDERRVKLVYRFYENSDYTGWVKNEVRYYDN